MSFEELDKKLQEAADLHHPAYDADAWIKMEKLLDKHLPVKEKKRRRIIFWWFIPFFLGGAFLASRFVLTSNKHVTDKNSSAIATNTNKKNNNTPVQSESAASRNVNHPENLIEHSKEPNTTTLTLNKPAFIKRNGLNKVVTNIKVGNWPSPQPSLAHNKKIDIEFLANNTSTNQEQNKNESVGAINKSIHQLSANNNPDEPVVEASASAKKENDVTQPSATVVYNTMPTNTIHMPATDSILKKETIPSSKGKKKNQFFVSFSAAADVSFVTGNNPGTAKIISGGGIGYSIKDKITIRAGFYSGNKIYTAGGNSYKGDAIFYQYYPYLESVNANCKVYEIPLSTSISFAKRKKDNLFASVGVSTLLMKKETYDYYYKYTPSGSLYEKSWTINNKNKHIFSVLTLSGGYQHILGKKTFFIVEPYFKMPLTGVGSGKVKLNSAGVLFTAGFKLF